jgi:DNA-binding PadR family transcriptional regulator
VKKVSIERVRKSDRVVPRRVSFEEVAASMEEEPHEPRTRAPGRSATLDLALLGLVAEAPGVSGYDIVKIFDLSMTHYWHAHPPQIYATLERMGKFGIIKRRKVAQRKRPNKHVYTITPAGERILVEWLEGPFEGMKLKHPPLLRCRFLGHLGADGAREILAEERLSWVLQLRVYREIERKHFAGGKAYRDVNTMFTMFTLKRGIDWMEENIRWCDWALGEIERNRALFPAVSMRAGLKPLIPYDPIVHGAMAFAAEEEGKRKYARRKLREQARAAASVAPAADKHSKGSRPYPRAMDWK